MNIEAYDLDSLRKIIRELQGENESLKEQLRQAGAAYYEQDFFSDKIEEYLSGGKLTTLPSKRKKKIPVLVWLPDISRGE